MLFKTAVPNKYGGPERRHYEDTHEWLQGLPIWVKLLFQILFIYGPLTVIAMYLVWRGGEKLPSLETGIARVEQKVDALAATQLEIKGLTQEQTNILRYICAGVVKTERDRRACFDPRYRDQ